VNHGLGYSREVASYKSSYSRAFTWYKLRNAVYNHFAEEAREGIKVLEVGCGSGANIQMINDLSPLANEIEYYGIDISPKAIEAANNYKNKSAIKNCVFEVGDAESLKFDDSYFDIVVCTEVLEHLLNPRAALREIYRVIKIGGSSIITTPNNSNIWKMISRRRLKARIEKDVEKMNPYKMRNNRYGHISTMRSKEILSICKEIGFQVEKAKKGSIVYGLPFYDRHQVLFALLLILDSILDRMPWNLVFSWGLVIKLKKAYRH
jgi:ubiquinone/menaquinone biosynthesis C-methylase UbiE